MKTFDLEDVIESMFKAEECNGSIERKAAFKAHATRRLKSYVNRRCSETGARPSQIVAAVKASFTKRKS